MDRIAQLFALDQTIAGLDALLQLSPASSEHWKQQRAALEQEKQATGTGMTETEKQCYALRDATSEFQRRRSEWHNAICNTEDINTVHSQINRLLWREAVTRCVSKSIEMAKQGDKVPLNAALFEMINEGYFVQQALAIRRLVDQHFKFEDEEKGVLSLIGVLLNMKKHRHLFTRASMLRAEGVVYDYESLRENEIKAGAFRGEWLRSERRHEMIDKLCGVSASKRRPSDAVKPEIFSKLSKRLAHCSEEIVTFTNKFLAHAANKASRGEDYKGSVTAKDVRLAQRVVVETSDFITVNLMGKNQHGGLAVPQYDVFEHIEKPLVKRMDVKELDKTWGEFDDEVHTWNIKIDSLLAETNDSSPAPAAEIPAPTADGVVATDPPAASKAI